ncbi:ribonuclease H family protein (plasmid) [Paenibacillus thiaminolyticus]|uniref:ribonuclease H family protein n=1 Tax=Paenibacillus thiaminolyticus TaxID=49283 RepID=UPI00232C922E|nr:ribonuclease H family protein [Paenibacillus thiaminolyticus]WCF11616.1 ribonuclease H family protein [Paenibacillus thiaminolyticus]
MANNKKQKFYAIKKGKDPITQASVSGIILTDWNEAKLYVTGVPGAEYKSFISEDQAQAFLQIEKGTVISSFKMQPDILYAYVDGSFNEAIPNYSFGLCCVQNEKVIHIDKGLGKKPDAVEMRQIGGELLGAINSLLYAKSKNFKQVVILHDYIGVANHATGTWKRSNDLSKSYHDWMQNFFNTNPNIKVNFIKVDAHTGDDYNEIADGLAKIAVGIKPNSIFYKMLKKHNLNDYQDGDLLTGI